MFDMKISSLFFIAACSAVTLFPACNNDGAAAKDTAAENTGAQPAANDPSAALSPAGGDAPAAVLPPPGGNAAKMEPPQNATGVWHYTCPKGCAGGAGSAIACATCGATLTHNTTYHGSGTPATPPTITPSGMAPAPAANPAAAKPEPAQNAAGVWHYTCPGGCPGGGGAAAACAKCGKTLAHNTAYHQ